MVKRVKVKIRDRWYTVEVRDLETNPVSVLVDGEPVEVDTDQLVASRRPAPLPESVYSESSEETRDVAGTAPATKVFRTPMPGVIVSLSVKAGDQVVTGDEVCILEAMKMQQSLRADWTGIVRTVHVQAGQQVLDGDPIIELE